MHAPTAYAAHAAAPAPRSAGDGAMPVLYRAAVGPIQTERYLQAFERMDAAGRALPGWNWAAALCTLSWMVFRQLWGAALFYVAALEGVALLVFALGHKLLGLPVPVLAGVLLACLLAASVLPGLYGDALFHAEARKKITKALSASATVQQAIGLLALQAATRRRLGWIVGANVALLAAALGLWAAFPDGGRSALEGLRAPTAAVPAPAQEPAVAEPPAPVNLPIEAAASEAAPVAVAVADAAEPAASTAPAPAEPPVPVAPPPEAPASAAPPPAAATPAPPPARRAAASRPAAASASASAPRQLYLNVGLFADPANARRAHARLRGAGLPASLGTVTMGSGRKLTRVRVGPFATTSDANAAAAKVRALGLDAAAFQQ